MRFSLAQLLAPVATVTAVAFVLSFVTRHSRHGFGLYLGDVAWPTLLVGGLVTVVLGAAVLVRGARCRVAVR